MVANTDSKVAKVVGKNDFSGSKDAVVWSIVFNKLNSANFNSQNVLYRNQDPNRPQREPCPLNFAIDTIMSFRGWVQGRQDPVAQLLLGLTIAELRPGVYEMLTDALNEFIKTKLPHIQPNFSVVVLADYICRYLAKRFNIIRTEWKPLLKVDLPKSGCFSKRLMLVRLPICLKRLMRNAKTSCVIIFRTCKSTFTTCPILSPIILAFF